MSMDIEVQGVEVHRIADGTIEHRPITTTFQASAADGGWNIQNLSIEPMSAITVHTLATGFQRVWGPDRWTRFNKAFPRSRYTRAFIALSDACDGLRNRIVAAPKPDPLALAADKIDGRVRQFNATIQQRKALPPFMRSAMTNDMERVRRQIRRSKKRLEIAADDRRYLIDRVKSAIADCRVCNPDAHPQFVLAEDYEFDGEDSFEWDSVSEETNRKYKTNLVISILGTPDAKVASDKALRNLHYVLTGEWLGV